jgi:glycosyltransferase involved in cell wall biosynthesis
MNPRETQQIDVVLPAHNEGESIGHTLTEFYEVATKKHGIQVRFVVCEDGSKDNTVEVLRDVATRVPLKLISDPVRKGYTKAVIDGFMASETPIVAFIDADGQCDPDDLPKLLERIPHCDLVKGYRSPRADPLDRRAMSAAFGGVYRLLFSVPLRDPSCPYLVMKRDALMRVLAGNVGHLRQGLWWEFIARARVLGLAIEQVPIHHRPRTHGTSVSFVPSKIPRIAADNLLGLLKLKRELAKLR